MAAAPTPTARPARACVTLLAALALLVAACATEQQQASPESGAFSGPDVAFLQGMIPHHRTALELAELVPERTERQELVRLVGDLREEQEAELEQLEALMERSGGQPPDADAGGDVHDGAGAAVADDDRADLRELAGTPFDLTFLDRMISHHRAGIADAQVVLDAGDHPEVRALAERIIAAREGELARMEAWRDAWGDEATEPVDGLP